MGKDKSLSKSEAIELVAKTLDGPIEINEFAENVLDIWSSSAKDPKATIRTELRNEVLGRSVLKIDRNTLYPMKKAMRDVSFRVFLSKEEVEQGIFLLSPALLHYVNPTLEAEKYLAENENGMAILTPIISVKEDEFSYWGGANQALNLSGWYQNHYVTEEDCVIITILDWETARFKLEIEKKEDRVKQKLAIEQVNQKIADYIFNALENERSEDVHSRFIAPNAYFHFKGYFEEHNVVPDHWLAIVEWDPRLQYWFYSIGYAEWEDMFSSGERSTFNMPTPTTPQLSQSKNDNNLTYRLKAYLAHRKTLWRRIEIRGDQTLGDLDAILKDAFNHDDWDHLAGFWKMERRGQTRNFREIDLGTVHPFEGDECEEITVASLGLDKERVKLKYVYDFGDWIDHRIELEDIYEIDTKVEYPRIIAKNKPKYKFCQPCKEKGKEIIAHWICYRCSYEEVCDVVFCEECMNKHDDDHYIEEMLY